MNAGGLWTTLLPPPPFHDHMVPYIRGYIHTCTNILTCVAARQSCKHIDQIVVDTDSQLLRELLASEFPDIICLVQIPSPASLYH